MSVYEASAGDVGVGIAVEAKTSWAIIRPPGPLPAPAKFDISIPLEEARVLAKGLANTRLDNAGLASCVWAWGRGAVGGAEAGWGGAWGLGLGGELEAGSGCDEGASADSVAV